MKRGKKNKMTIYQSFNKRINAWVKYHFLKGEGIEFFDVKQRNSWIPFTNIKIVNKNSNRKLKRR